MKNGSRIKWILFILLVMMVVFVGCEEEIVYEDLGTIEFSLVNEDYTVDAEYYVFTGIMPNEDDGGEFFWPVSWETLEQADWKHTIGVMDAGEWKVSVYAVASSPGEKYDATNPPPSVRKSENITFTLKADTVKPVAVDLGGSSVEGQTVDVTFSIPPEERADADAYYAFHGDFYWDSEDDINTGTTKEDLVSPENDGKFMISNVSGGRWAFYVYALDRGPEDSGVPTILRRKSFIYLKVSNPIDEVLVTFDDED